MERLFILESVARVVITRKLHTERLQHLATFLSTLPTGLCAGPAMRSVVPLTLGCTPVTGFGTGQTEFTNQRTATSHCPECARTGVRAIPVKPNALDHHLDILFI